MSKYLNVPNGDYKVSVQTGGTIYLDTGFEQGRVEISGDLIVQGDTTTINTAELTIEDRVIELNKGDDTASGIQGTDAFSGIQINRGVLPHAFFGYDEDVSGFIGYDAASNLISFATNKIDSRSQNLTLDSGSSTVNVNSTVDYEQKIFTYDGLGNLTGYNASKADTIPNTQAVVDYVAYNFANVFLRQIGDGVLDVTSITIDDEENTGNPSVITFAIDGTTVSEVYADRWDFDEVRITGTTIETINSGPADLVLRANGTGNIKIDDMLHISSVPNSGDATTEPAFPNDGIKIYISDQYTGKTGIYFANAEENRDELVSKNRALLFGMLF
jgi:hypothetical protein